MFYRRNNHIGARRGKLLSEVFGPTIEPLSPILNTEHHSSLATIFRCCYWLLIIAMHVNTSLGVNRFDLLLFQDVFECFAILIFVYQFWDIHFIRRPVDCFHDILSELIWGHCLPFPIAWSFLVNFLTHPMYRPSTAAYLVLTPSASSSNLSHGVYPPTGQSLPSAGTLLDRSGCPPPSQWAAAGFTFPPYCFTMRGPAFQIRSICALAISLTR